MCDCPCHDHSPFSAEDLVKLKKLGVRIKEALKLACEGEPDDEES